MDHEQHMLARRAVDCRDWSYLAGMLVADGASVRRLSVDCETPENPEERALPVFGDAGTVGALFSHIHRLYGSGPVSMWLSDSMLWTLILSESRIFIGRTMAETLVNALAYHSKLEDA